MRFLVVLSLAALAFAQSPDQYEVKASPLECVFGATSNALNTNFEDFMSYLKKLNPKDSAKATIEKLRGERDSLKSTFKNGVEEAQAEQKRCIEDAKDQGSLIPTARCALMAKSKFAIAAGSALGKFGVNVTKIIVQDNVNFHGKNLKEAIELAKRHVKVIGDAAREAVKCF